MTVKKAKKATLAIPAKDRKRAQPVRKPRPLGATLLTSFAWVGLAAMSVGTAVSVALTDHGAARLAILSTPAANRPVIYSQNTQEAPLPEFAALQEEVIKLRSDMRRVALEKSALSKRLASIENDFDSPTTTASIPPTDGLTMERNRDKTTHSEYLRLPKQISSNSPQMTMDKVQSAVRSRLGEAPATGPSDPLELMQTSFAVELGHAGSMADLKETWSRLADRHGPELEGLSPLVVVRETVSGELKLHLLAGPIANAADAVQMCVKVRNISAQCTPVPYEGQRLALH